jgi:hypothetical protein
MPFEHIIWRFLSKKRFGTFIACLLIPELIVFTEVNLKPFSMTQRFVWAGVGAGLGFLAFALLSAHDWLEQAIRLRKSRFESVRRLELVRLSLYLVALPLIVFSILLVIVICFF